ncbi:MAG: DMT family transporter [Candidatus Jordarchaeales archaeon]
MIGELTALTSALCWAVAAILYKSVMDENEINPFLANFIRLIPVSVVLFLLVWGTGELWKLWQVSVVHLAYLITGSMIGIGLGDTAYILAIKYAGVSRGVAISSTYPLFTFAIDAVMKMTVDPVKLLAVALIVAAIWILSREDSKEGVVDIRKGVMLSMVTAVLWAVGVVMVELALRGIDFYVANMVRFPVLAVLTGALLLVTGGHRSATKMARRQVVMLTLAGLVGLAIGGLAFFASIALIGAAEAAALASLSPIFSAALSVLSGKERLSLRTILGTTLAVLGVIILVIRE